MYLSRNNQVNDRLNFLSTFWRKQIRLEGVYQKKEAESLSTLNPLFAFYDAAVEDA